MDYREDSGQVVWLVQHGQTTWDAMGWVQGHVDRARVTRLGRQQIRRAADQLGHQSVAAVYSSDLLRSRQTARAIANRLGCDVRTDRRLRERRFGIAEGVPWAEVPSAATGIVDGRIVDDMARPPGGESLHHVYERCLSFLFDLMGQAHRGDVVVVAHDGSIRMLRAIVDDAELCGLKWELPPKAEGSPVALRLPVHVDTAS